MRYTPWDTLESSGWYSFNDEPVEGSSLIAPRLSDPTILLPAESPDGRWHMFCHTWLGVHHYTSSSGFNWHHEKLLFWRGHSPCIYREGSLYYLLYENHDKEWGRKKDITKKGSRILISSSSDLITWSEPRIILEAETVSYASYREGYPRVARPQLIEWEGRYILYFGVGEARMFDTGQKTSVKFSCATAEFIEGPYKVQKEPLLTIDPLSETRNLAVGSIRIVPCSDRIAAVECSYIYDREKNRSRSLMLLLSSTDGFTFETEKVMQTQPETGWSSRAITACDLKYMEEDSTWYCYYSANGPADGRIPIIREYLGLLLGKPGRQKTH